MICACSRKPAVVFLVQFFFSWRPDCDHLACLFLSAVSICTGGLYFDIASQAAHFVGLNSLSLRLPNNLIGEHVETIVVIWHASQKCGASIRTGGLYFGIASQDGTLCRPKLFKFKTT